MNWASQGKLVWRCRRGMKELDMLLLHWLEQSYPSATDAEKALFRNFLDLPDPEIARYLLGHESPTDPALAALVAKLTAHRA